MKSAREQRASRATNVAIALANRACGARRTTLEFLRRVHDTLRTRAISRSEINLLRNGFYRGQIDRLGAQPSKGEFADREIQPARRPILDRQRAPALELALVQQELARVAVLAGLQLVSLTPGPSRTGGCGQRPRLQVDLAQLLFPIEQARPRLVLVALPVRSVGQLLLPAC
jgi:hypothetical protein